MRRSTLASDTSSRTVREDESIIWPEPENKTFALSIGGKVEIVPTDGLSW
jgi:hypothetical protein